MSKRLQPGSSIFSASSRRQTVAAFASMSIIPLLTLVYLLFTYGKLDEDVPTDVLVVIALNLVLSLGGMVMLARMARALFALRAYIERDGAGQAPEELGRASTEIGTIANAAEAMNRELDAERQWLKDMSVAIEDLSRERAEDRVRHEAMISTIVEASPFAMMVLDAKGTITSANAAAADILGISEEDLVGRPHNSQDWQISDVEGNRLADDDMPFVVAREKGGAVYGLKFRATRPGGAKVLISADVFPFFDHSAVFHGAVMTLEEAGS